MPVLAKRVFGDLSRSADLAKEDFVVLAIRDGTIRSKDDLETLVEYGVPMTARTLTFAILEFEWPERVMEVVRYADENFPTLLFSRDVQFSDWPTKAWLWPASAAVAAATLYNEQVLVTRVHPEDVEIPLEEDKVLGPLRFIFEEKKVPLLWKDAARVVNSLEVLHPSTFKELADRPQNEDMKDKEEWEALISGMRRVVGEGPLFVVDFCARNLAEVERRAEFEADAKAILAEMAASKDTSSSLFTNNVVA